MWMLVMKVVDKEFLFLPIYPFLFWDRSPKRKVQYLLFISSQQQWLPPPLSIRI